MGMSVTEFWDGEAELCTYYRRADENNRQRKNYELWLQGKYIYEVMADLYQIYHPLMKHPKAIPYLKKPFPLTEKEAQEQKQAEMREKELIFKAQLKAIAAKEAAERESDLTDGRAGTENKADY